MSEFKMNRKDFEEILSREDLVEAYGSKSKEEIEEMFGKTVARMVGYDQNNPHHCYDLWNHTLRTVAGINPQGLTKDNLTKLRVAAFFHDIAKPDVMTIDKRTGNSRFFGHAEKSAKIAEPILEELGYSKEDRDVLGFLIGHHDDFISYKSTVREFQKNHAFVRLIKPESIAEKMVENKYDFEALGIKDPKKVRAICYEIIADRPLTVSNPVTKEVESIKYDKELFTLKARTGKYDRPYQPGYKDYTLLLKLIKADANAQSVEVKDKDGTVISTREEKVKNVENLEKDLYKASEIFADKRLKSSKEQLLDVMRFLGLMRINRAQAMGEVGARTYLQDDTRVGIFDPAIKSSYDTFEKENSDLYYILNGLRNRAIKHKESLPANSVLGKLDCELIDDIDFVRVYSKKDKPFQEEIVAPLSDEDYTAFNIVTAVKGSLLLNGNEKEIATIIEAMKKASPRLLEKIKELAVKSNIGSKDSIDLVFIDTVEKKIKDDATYGEEEGR